MDRQTPYFTVYVKTYTDLPYLGPEDPLTAVTRYFAAYNLVCGPVVDDENHLLGAVSVDDVLDHLLPDDWREREEPELSGAVTDVAGRAAAEGQS